jgi:hypothetical protein
MVRNRSISSIIGNKPTKRPSRPSVRSTRKKDNKVPCHCNKCNGKLVLIRTKLFHESADTTHKDSAVKPPNLDELSLGTGSPADTRIKTTDDISPNLPSVPRRRPRRYISHPQVTDDMSDFEDEQHIESSLSEDNKHSKRQRIESEDNESESDDLLISETFEDYSVPKYDKMKKRK